MVDAFGRNYGSFIPGKVYFHLPSRAIWYGKYIHGNFTIAGLKFFKKYYNINSSTLMAVEYVGGQDFKLEIFNCYAMEIDYRLKVITFENGTCMHKHDGSVVDRETENNDIEIEKVWTTLNFSVGSSSCKYLQLTIRDYHLNHDNFKQVYFNHLYFLVVILCFT